MERNIKSLEKETYISPDIEIVHIETEQSILQAGSQAGSNELPGMPGEDW